MSDDTTLNTKHMISAINGYIDQSKSDEDLKYIGQIFANKSLDFKRLLTIFTNSLESYDSRKAKKACRVFEYLTLASSEKME